MILATADSNVVPYSPRPELVLGEADHEGCRVAKDSSTGEFYRLGPEESFLLVHLDGQRSARAICSAYEEQFGQAFTSEELDEFIALAHAHGLLKVGTAEPSRATVPAPIRGTPSQPAAAPPSPPGPRQSLLRLRFKLFDPNRLFGWLCPRLGFVWTRAFALGSLAFIAVAGMVAWANRDGLVSHFHQALNWQTMALV
jgi:hypothetical protein